MPQPFDLDATIKEIQDFCTRVDKSIDDIRAKFNAAVQHIDSLKWVLGPVMLPISIALNTIVDAFDKLTKLVSYALKHEGPIVSLVYQSFNWVNHVQHPLNGVYDSSSGPAPQQDSTPSYHNENLADWQGDAKQIYDSKVTDQRAAINAMATTASIPADWLIGIAKGNVEYMAKLAEMVSTFLIKIAGAGLESAAVVELPFSVQSVADAVEQLVSDYVNQLIGIANRFMATLQAVEKLTSAMNPPALPSGHWPQAVHHGG